MDVRCRLAVLGGVGPVVHGVVLMTVGGPGELRGRCRIFCSPTPSVVGGCQQLGEASQGDDGARWRGWILFGALSSGGR